MAPRLVVLSLASDFGCQVQLTNMTGQILDVLGLVDLSYWQLATSGHMPSEYDVAIIEGAVTTDEHVVLIQKMRETAAVVIAIGSCANTGGIPAMANLAPLEDRYRTVYGDGASVAPGRRSPAPVDAFVKVDYHVPGCPIDTDEFLRVLSRVLLGLSDRTANLTMCASCKEHETICFYDMGVLCAGLVTAAGCGARCPSLGRPCAGCRGLADDANLDSARNVAIAAGLPAGSLDDILRIYNTAKEVQA